MADVKLPYADRAEAGRTLAQALHSYGGRDDLVVLALPRGGVPVGYEVAQALGAPLDVCVVRKLGVPHQPELAMGAIALGGARVLNEQVIRQVGIDQNTIEAVARQEQQELDRRNAVYRGQHEPPGLGSRCVILVDDGLATGSTIKAAAAAVRQHEPGSVVIAVPVAPRDALPELRRVADEVVCPAAPQWFLSVSQWYQRYDQVSDDQVRELLELAWRDTSPDRA